jgi:magnesium transporter
MIRVIARQPDGSWQTGIDPEEISEMIGVAEVMFWVDLTAPTDSEYASLSSEFGFHPLAIEDVIKQHQRPKIDIYDDHYFLVLYSVTCKDVEKGPDLHELEMFVGANYVVTVHDDYIGEVEDTIKQWQRNVEAIGVDIGVLVYTLLDRIVDDYFPVIDTLADHIEDIEHKIFEDFDKRALEEIFTLKKHLLNMRRVIAPERDIFNVLLRRDPPILPAASIPYFMDVYDHTIRVSDTLDIYRDLLSGALDAYLSIQGNRLNETMYRLAMISTIFLPLTFLTGFFGMNFIGIPFGSNVLLIVALTSMVVVPGILYVYFKRNYEP